VRMSFWGLGLVAAGLVAGMLPAVALAGTTPATAKPVPAEVRVNQVGYAENASKVAFVMLPARASRVKFSVAGGRGSGLWGVSTDYVGGWNSTYRAVYEVNFSALHWPGTYRITATADGLTARSPAFRIASPAALYHQLVLNAVRYFTSERDGADVVPSVLDRKAANLTDEKAYVYATPKYDSNDNLLGTFHKIGGPVNVSGGWFDAGGGYEKFAYTASYADALLLLADRNSPGVYSTLNREAQFGLQWLEKLWNPKKKVLYIQVGIGNGNASNTIQGDYNFWFLPQAEDRMDVKKGGNPGPTAYFVKYRPVFEAAPPGKPISPEFAGRFAADFGLAAQLAARTDPARARYLLSLAQGIYAMAKTKDVGQIVTTYPYDYYSGTEWKSDMLWGADEIAMAEQAVHAAPGAVHRELETAAYWARQYIAQGHPKGGDTLNLYDNGALGEGELLRALRHAPGRPVIAPRTLVNDLAAQLRLGEQNSAGDPFELGVKLGPNDASPHAFGLYITNALYQEYGGGHQFAAFAQQQLNYALGGNPWGASFVVGAGTTYPHCMQSEIANLAGSLDGKGDIQLGAVTDGPSDPSWFEGLTNLPTMRTCSYGNYASFDTSYTKYQDAVADWPSDEPADDYTANSLLAFSFAAHSPGPGFRR
jgi:endoglucanase